MDKSKINILNNLLKGVILLKPDKGNGIVLVNCLDYKKNQRTKFCKIKEDLTLRSLQQYLCKLKEHKEISEETHQRIRPQNRRLSRAHALPKIQKDFVNLPRFRPIVNTTGIVHYQIGRYLSELLNLLASNEYTMKGSPDAVTQIKNIAQEFFDQCYRFVSFDSPNLFLQKTINIILKEVSTTIKKNTMRNL